MKCEIWIFKTNSHFIIMYASCIYFVIFFTILKYYTVYCNQAFYTVLKSPCTQPCIAFMFVRKNTCNYVDIPDTGIYVHCLMLSPLTLNKKSLKGQGKSMVTVLQKKFLVQWMNLHDFAATVFSWVNQENFRYLIVISFQGGIFCPNRPVFNLMILYQLYTVQLTQEKEKSSVAQCSQLA